MNKISHKFMLSLSAVMVPIILLSLFLNAHFIERFFLYRERQELSKIGDYLLDEKKDLMDAVKEMESENDVVIAWVENTDDNDLLNERLRQEFLNKGIGLKKYWLWEQDQLDIVKDGRKMRIYHQEKLHYSLLVEYIYARGYFIASAKMIPSTEQTISFVNRITAIIFFCAAVLILFIAAILVKRITKPLKEIGETTKAIAALDFKTIQVNTKDELSVLAENINDMSISLKEANEKLERKNNQMKELLANISHDLKTPVSLIKAYGMGMEDGMDDGTFLSVILEQNRKMEQTIERLLMLSKIEMREKSFAPVNLSQHLQNLVKLYEIQANEKGLELCLQLEDDIVVDTEEEAFELICTNLLSNAVKYAKKGKVEIRLANKQGNGLFQIRNNLEEENHPDITRLFEPFYVGEASRNKDKSGTGLGLAIVKKTAEEYGFSCEAEINGNEITFTILFVKRM